MDNNSKACNVCSNYKDISDFIGGRNICKDCNNQRRRDKYYSNEEHRIKLIKIASEIKHNKVVIRQQQRAYEKQRLEEEIGIDNRICKYCKNVVPKSNFRHNRQKCLSCEQSFGREYVKSSVVRVRLAHKRRHDPIFKFMSCVRGRIKSALERKQTSSIEYLGCNATEYYKWMHYCMGDRYSFEEHGTVWHIDHVIPLRQFDLTDIKQQLQSFNWRNTSPLDAKENLRKNKNIIKSQIEEHLNKLKQYHIENNIELPQEYIELYAKHLVAGNPLEPMIPLLTRKSKEEHD